MRTLVNLQIGGDPAWDEAPWGWGRPHESELTQTEVQKLVAGLPRKSPNTRAVTLETVLLAEDGDEAVLKTIRPALIAAWDDLPLESRRVLITSHWRAICAPEMLPVLRHIVAEPPPPRYDSNIIQIRNAALKRLNEFDPAAAGRAIAADLLDPNADPSVDVVELLRKEDVAPAIPAALERIRTDRARNLDYYLLDRYANATFLALVQAAFNPRDAFWPRRDGLLRYFLRVDPAYGLRQLQATLQASERRYYDIFARLGDELPRVQQLAIQVLNDPDPEVAVDAAGALGKWGAADAEPALWARLEQFHNEWARREGEFRYTGDDRSPGLLAANLERSLAAAIMTGNTWICGPDKLARLRGLVWLANLRSEIDVRIAEWQARDASIFPSCCGEDRPTFSLLQYISLTEDQLRLKLAQLPKGMRLSWQFWPPGQFFRPFPMAKQEAFYERMRTVAEKHGITLEKVKHP